MRDKRSRQQWKNILDNNLWEFEDVQKGLLAPLLLSYYELPSAIKRCFLYCAVFPKDYVFSRNNLVYLWMAQGYLDLKQNIEMEIIGEEYFEKLVMRSFFQDFEKGDNDDDKVKDHFDIRMWVCVSEPFDRCRFAQAIIQEVERASPKRERSSSNITEFGTLLQIVQSLIEGKNFFLILDDMWTEDIKEWEPFKLALKCGAQDSKILITTRNEKVAKMVDSGFMTNLGKLSEKHCWLIINKIAFDGMDENQREQLKDIGRELANKCKGLPLQKL